MLGLGAGDEDGGRDVEGEAVELLLAGDVLDGLVGEAALDGDVVCSGFLGRELAAWVCIEGGAGETRGVQQEDERILRRGGVQLG